MKNSQHLLLSFFCFFHILLFAQSDVLVHADQMPYFSGCENFEKGSAEKRACSNETLVSFLAHNVQYPSTAKIRGTEGTVYVSFIINEKGKMIDASILRDIGDGCGKAALDVLAKMPDWQPGVHEGAKVKVKLNLPIHFSLKNQNTGPILSNDYQITWGDIIGKKISVADVKRNSGQEIIVRDQFGDPVIFDKLTFSYEKGRTFNTATSNGKMDKKQKKIVKKIKAGSKFYIGVVLQKEDQKIRVGREFEIEN